MKKEAKNIAIEIETANTVATAKKAKTQKPRETKEDKVTADNLISEIEIETANTVATAKKAKTQKPRETKEDKLNQIIEAIVTNHNITERNLFIYGMNKIKQKQTTLDFFEKLLLNLTLGKISFDK